MIVQAETLRDILYRAFAKLGLPITAARRAADVLVLADLRGIESHGSVRLPSFYAPLLRNGTINPTAKLRVARHHKALTVLDAQSGAGIALTACAMYMAIRLARSHGIGLVWVINSSHFGIASYYTMMAAKAGMVGLVMTNGYPAVVPPGGCRAILGTNAISLACPRLSQWPFVIDTSLSAVSIGQLESSARQGLSVPAAWAAEIARYLLAITTDSDMAPEQLLRQRLLAPLGGSRADGYKGFALGLVVEALTAMLGGGVISTALCHGQAAHLCAAINPDEISSISQIDVALKTLERELSSTPVLPGYSALRLPGTHANAIQEQRLEQGIPLIDDTVRLLSELLLNLGETDSENILAHNAAYNHVYRV